MRHRAFVRAAVAMVWLAAVIVAAAVGEAAQAQGGTYSEDLEDGEAQGWILEPGWAVINEDGNRVLAGDGHVNAIWPAVADNVRISLRLRLLSGVFHLPFRASKGARYFITISSGGSSLGRNTPSGEAQDDLVGEARAFSLGDWHQLELLLHGGRIEFRVDGERAWVYVDPDPLTGGMLALESLPESPVRVDDIKIITGEPVPGTDTPGPSRTLPAPTPRGTYEEDFEDGLAHGWELAPGWTLTLDQGNQVLAGKSGGSRASMSGSGVEVGDNVRVSMRLKLLQGTFHLGLHGGPAGLYFISINNSFSSMNRQPHEGRFEEHIVRSARYTSPERWQQLELVRQGGRFEFLVDGRRQWVYTDPEPMPAGTMSFGLVPGSEVLIDDIVVTSANLTHATPTFGLEGLATMLAGLPSSTASPATPAERVFAAQTVLPTAIGDQEQRPSSIPCLGALFVPLAIVGALGLSRPRGAE